MTIQNLVTIGKLQEAISLIDDADGTLLASRLNSLNRDIRLGIISNDNATMERNRIISAILHYGSEIELTQSNDSPFPSTKTESKLSDKIAEFLNLNKRGKFKKDIESLLNKVEKYESKKKRDQFHDRRGSILEDLNLEFKNLKEKMNEKAENNTDKLLKDINNLLDDGSKIAVQGAINKLKLFWTDSSSIQSLQTRLDDVGDIRSHRNLIINDIDGILRNNF